MTSFFLQNSDYYFFCLGGSYSKFGTFGGDGDIGVIKVKKVHIKVGEALIGEIYILKVFLPNL